MAYFSVWTDCGKLSLLYSDIFSPFHITRRETDEANNRKKNNYRRQESAKYSGFNTIMFSGRVNHFRKGVLRQAFQFNSFQFFSPLSSRKGTVTLDIIWHAERSLYVPTQHGAGTFKAAHLICLAACARVTLLFYIWLKRKKWFLYDSWPSKISF